jgi:hypothetical protein
MKPEHYKQMNIDVYEFAFANGLNMLEGNIIKYVCRRKDNRIEDLKKAMNTLERLIELENDLPR